MRVPDRRVELARSGGVAGVTLRAACETADLSAEESTTLEQLLSRTSSGPTPGTAPTGADRYQYDLTVSDQEGQRTLSFQEDELEPEERRMLNRLIASRRTSGR